MLKRLGCKRSSDCGGRVVGETIAFAVVVDMVKLVVVVVLVVIVSTS